MKTTYMGYDIDAVPSPSALKRLYPPFLRAPAMTAYRPIIVIAETQHLRTIAVARQVLFDDPKSPDQFIIEKDRCWLVNAEGVYNAFTDFQEEMHRWHHNLLVCADRNLTATQEDQLYGVLPPSVSEIADAWLDREKCNFIDAGHLKRLQKIT